MYDHGLLASLVAGVSYLWTRSFRTDCRRGEGRADDQASKVGGRAPPCICEHHPANSSPNGETGTLYIYKILASLVFFASQVGDSSQTGARQDAYMTDAHRPARLRPERWPLCVCSAKEPSARASRRRPSSAWRGRSSLSPRMLLQSRVARARGRADSGRSERTAAHQRDRYHLAAGGSRAPRTITSWL